MKFLTLIASLCLLSACVSSEGAIADSQKPLVSAVETPSTKENMPHKSEEFSTESPRFVSTAKPIACGPTKMVIDGITGEPHKEQPLLLGVEPLTLNTGQVAPVPVTFFVNSKTGTFTFLQILPNPEVGGELTCILSSGKISDYNEPMLGKILSNSPNNIKINYKR